MSLEPSPSSPPSSAQHTHQSRSRHHASSVWFAPLNINPCSDCKFYTTVENAAGECCRWKLPPPDSSKQQLQAHQAWETSTWLRIFKPKFEKQLHARQNVLQGLSTSQGEHNHKRLRPSEKKASDSCILRSCQSTPWSQQTKPTHSKAIQSIVRSRPRMWISLQPRRMWRSN